VLSLTRRGFNAALLATGLSAAPGMAFGRQVDGWKSGFATPPERLDGDMLRLVGRLPTGLAGTLYRNGPAQFERAGERVGHWFDGDGMVQQFTLSQGRIQHRGRFVATSKRKAEAAAGHFIYGGYGFAPKAAAQFSLPDDLNAANTSILPMGDEIWALWEGGSPWRIDAQSLETIGRQSFPGEADGLIFSAHPKLEPNGTIWNFGGFGTRCVIWELSPQGMLRSVRPIPLPASTLMHDFAVTQNHIVLLAPPLIEAKRPATSLIDKFDWRPDLPFMAIVLDKHSLDVVRMFELPARFLYHVGNAWEDKDGTIRIDACLAKDLAFATRVARELPLGIFEEPPYAEPTLITLYANGRSEIAGVGRVAEFPTVDQRRVASRQRFTWTVLPHGLARWDWENGKHQRFDYGSQYWPEEPIFVPRDHSADEGEGWIVATRLNMKSRRSELVVFDASQLADGPLAIFENHYSIPLGFHGAFVRA
jgi:all-trans-8'-apo-beta-carotenal 15,15'-oxygenase